MTWPSAAGGSGAAVQVQSRDQETLELVLCDAATGAARELLGRAVVRRNAALNTGARLLLGLGHLHHRASPAAISVSSPRVLVSCVGAVADVTRATP